jgi:hypothetical protein
VVIVVNTVARMVEIWVVVVTSVMVAEIVCVDVDDTVVAARIVSISVAVSDAVTMLYFMSVMCSKG